MRNYHNTTHQAGDQLELFQQKAMKQDEAILVMFKRHKRLSASQCLAELEKATRLTWLITSVRRGITNLYNAGKLEKSKSVVTSPYGRPECIYQVCNKE